MPTQQLSSVDRMLSPAARRLRLPESKSVTERPEVDESLLRAAVDKGISGLSMAGNFLDTGGAMVRNTITGKSPIAAIAAPFSDENRVSGESMLQDMGLIGREPVEGFWNNVPRFAAGTALEIGLDPLTYLTLGLSAVPKAAKLLKNAGILDDATKVATSKAGRAVGPREARMMTTAREVVDSVGDAGRERYLTAYNAGRTDKALSFDEIPASLLNATLGANFGLKVPFGPSVAFKGVKLPTSAATKALDALPKAAQGPLAGVRASLETLAALPGGQDTARLMDNIGHGIRYSPPVRTLAPLFSRATMGMHQMWTQKDATRVFERMEEAQTLARTEVAELNKWIHRSKYMKGDVEKRMTDSLSMSDYLEGVAPLPEHMAADTGLVKTLDRIRELDDQMIDLSRDAGGKTTDLGNTKIKSTQVDELGQPIYIPSPVKHMFRVRQLGGGPMWKQSHGKSKLPIVDQFSISREDYTRHYTTSDLQRMSVDEAFAGKYDKGVFGPKQKIRDWFLGSPDVGSMGSTPVDLAERAKLKEKFFETYPPTKHIDEAYYTRNAVDDAGNVMVDKAGNIVKKVDPEVMAVINKRHSDLFDSITNLNSEQVKHKVPMYHMDPTENLLQGLESGRSTMAALQGARAMVTKYARLQNTSRFVSKDAPGVKVDEAVDAAVKSIGEKHQQYGAFDRATGLGDLLKEMKFDWDENDNLKKIMDGLGPQAHRIRDEMKDELVEDQTSKLVDLMQQSGHAIDPDEAIRLMKDSPQDLRKMVDGLGDVELSKKAGNIIHEGSKDISPKKVFDEFEIDADLAVDLAAFNRRFAAPADVSAIGAAYDAFTNLFKGSVTAPWLAFHVRNASSAFIQNVMNGVEDPTRKGVKRYLAPYRDAVDLMRGKPAKDTRRIEMFELDRRKANAFQKELDEASKAGISTDDIEFRVRKEEVDMRWVGMDDAAADALASEKIKEMLFAHGLTDSPGMINDITGATSGNVASHMLGETTFRDAVRAPEGATWGDVLNPLKTPGVGSDMNAFAPIRYGRAVGDHVEKVVRTAPFIAFLKQGMTPAEAAKRVKQLQVNYSNLTDFERNRMRRAIPFYSFQKGMTSFLANELTQRPGGPTAMMIKGAANASGNDPGAPAHIRSGFNVPWSTSPEGDRTYLVGAGLMHEPPIQMLGPGVQETLFNIGRILHPLPKAAMELASNRSMFMEGPDGGGRALHDLDPLLGRTISNIGNTLGLTDREAAVRIPGGKFTEAVISNSPLSRTLHTVRKMTDPRKGLGTKVLDATSGFKFAAVDAKMRSSVLKEQASDLLRDLGGRDFSFAYMPENVFNSLPDEDQKKALQLKELLRQTQAEQRKFNEAKKAPPPKTVNLPKRNLQAE